MHDSNDPDRIIQMIPADGWVMRAYPGDREREELCPLAGWGLRASGDVVPLVPDPLGNVEEVDDSLSGSGLYRFERHGS